MDDDAQPQKDDKKEAGEDGDKKNKEDGIERESVDVAMAGYVDEEAEKVITELHGEPWYHGSLPLEDIANLVVNRGDFLMRELESEPGRPPMKAMQSKCQPCVTVRLATQLKDFPIHTVQVGDAKLFTIDGTNKARTALGIVQKHYEQKIMLPEETPLVRPIPKQQWELTKDKITLQTKLGEGAFGEVWKGTLSHSPTNTTKLKEENKTYMQELFKEARLMRQYKHINVVAFFGMVMENENVMIVMELINGGGLDHHLMKNRVGIPDKCSYAFDVALGLYYLHSKRCMHRDLACRNCLIDTQKNIVKISDFGLSKQADTYKIQATDKIPTKWQAPEVIETHIYTRECDVYSYGILISDPNFRPPLSPDLPDEIRVIISACWGGRPDRRPVMKDVAWILKKFQKHKLV
ncbi:unnamed protein product [Nippostrongylus brasiliensis]|uniref:non-specific protein-tyrosine kinase n=1 Tax=Nippostrongylus brasiliensis TaxID=27835 RepID=A0A0N4Y137_NIPBR|nr:unnamed protein product [Nippostrongylus brasiliensis]